MANQDDMDLEEPDTTIDPYETLKLSSTASDAEVRSAYRKLALKHHPDKVAPSEREEAHREFQRIAFAYAVLSDPKRRKRYDATGSTAESALDDDDFDWSDFFRQRYADVTAERVSEFEREYKHSAEERRDLLRAYDKCKGRLDRVYEEVMLSNPLDDEDRFQAILKDAIDKGEVEGFDAFLQESAKSRKRRLDKARREAEEAEDYAQELAEEKKKKKKNGRKGRKGEIEVDGTDSEDEEEKEDDNDNDDDDEDDEEDDGPRKPKARPKPKATSAKSAQAKKKSAKPGGLNDLAAMIQQRQQGRAATFLDDLEAKYAPKSSKVKRRTPIEEPSEEAFEKMAARKGSKKARK